MNENTFLGLQDRSTGRRALVRAKSIDIIRETDDDHATYIECGATAIVVTETFDEVTQMLNATVAR